MRAEVGQTSATPKSPKSARLRRSWAEPPTRGNASATVGEMFADLHNNFGARRDRGGQLSAARDEESFWKPSGDEMRAAIIDLSRAVAIMRARKAAARCNVSRSMPRRSWRENAGAHGGGASAQMARSNRMCPHTHALVVTPGMARLHSPPPPRPKLLWAPTPETHTHTPRPSAGSDLGVNSDGLSQEVDRGSPGTGPKSYTRIARASLAKLALPARGSERENCSDVSLSLSLLRAPTP